MNPFFITLILSIITNLIIKPAWVFTENKIQDHLGHQQMGFFAAIFAFSGIFLVLSDLGMSQWNVKEFSGKKDLLNQELSKIWGSKFLLSLLFFIVSLFFAFILGYSFEHIRWLFWIVIYQILISSIQLQRAQLQSLQLFRTDILLGNLDKAILLILCLFLLQTQQMNFIFFIDSLLLSALIPFILGGFILSRYLKIKKLNWDFQFLINTSKEFLPFAIMTILFSTNERINQVLIEKIAGETESGLFAGAYRWNNAIAMYLWTILPIFFAKFSHNKLDPPLNQSLFHLGWVIVAIPILFVAFWVQFYGEILFIQFSNSNSAEIQKMFLLLKILIATVALNACFNIFSTWLTASGFVHQTNKILFIAMSSNFFLSFILIPLYKSVGGSVALLAAFIIQSLGFFYYFLKHKNFNLEPKIFIKSVFVLISGIFLLFLGYKINLHWFLNTVVCIVWITVFLFAMKLIQWKKTD